MRKIIGARKNSKVVNQPKVPMGQIKEVRNILHAFEIITERVSGSGLSEEFFKEAAPAIDYAVKQLALTDIQVILLSIFVDKSDDRRIRLSEIAEYIGVRTVKVLQFLEDIEVLVQKHYIRTSFRGDDQSFSVPTPALHALRKNQPFIFEEIPVTDTASFFDRFKEMMDEMDNREIEYIHLEQQTLELLDKVKETEFGRHLIKYNMDSSDTTLFIFMAHLYVENNDDNIRFSDIEDLYDNGKLPGWLKRAFRNRSHVLFKFNLIENVNEDGLANPDAFKLTDKAKTEMLTELGLSTIGKSDKGLIKSDTLVKKKLIYNASEESQIKELSSILSPKRFKEVQSRLQKSGMRSGFCCLFHGAPGTGKTETVNQIALQTGRDIMRVDVDKIKSCWVGESEKNIKALFDRYRSICANSNHAPILLFNEADAVLGVRMEGASRAVDKMENSIQNIILQEMETLDGIMIATTNLTCNLDKAFERRFLYKIRFDRSTPQARAKIWRAMLPALKKKEAEILGSRYDLSGGEIENVVRRYTVNAILKGTDCIDFSYLEECCKVEKLTTAPHSRVGF